MEEEQSKGYIPQELRENLLEIEKECLRELDKCIGKSWLEVWPWSGVE